MRTRVKELKVGDIFKVDNDNKTFKVVEVSTTPLYTPDFEMIYPIICDSFSPEYGKTCGFRKVPEEIEEVELIYRESVVKYESWTNSITKVQE